MLDNACDMELTYTQPISTPTADPMLHVLLYGYVFHQQCKMECKSYTEKGTYQRCISAVYGFSTEGSAEVLATVTGLSMSSAPSRVFLPFLLKKPNCIGKKEGGG